MDTVTIDKVREYLESLEGLTVTPSQIRDHFHLNIKGYHKLRTALPRWARQGKISNPTRGWYGALPVYNDLEETLKQIPPEEIKFHNFQLVGQFPKNLDEKMHNGGWGNLATLFRTGTKTIQLSWGGSCKIIRYSNRKMIYQTNNSNKPWDLPKTLLFFGWVQGTVTPYDISLLSLRVKQVDVHFDNLKINLSPATAMRIEYMTHVLYQIYNKKPLGATRIEVPAKINITPGNFIDLLCNIKGGRIN